MKRFQARQSRGRFTRNTTENTFGFHTVVCALCRRFNTWNVGEPRPQTCHACGKPLRDIDESESPSYWMWFCDDPRLHNPMSGQETAREASGFGCTLHEPRALAPSPGEMISVLSKVRAYEANGKNIVGLEAPHVHVESHWNYPERVVLVWPNGEKLTVLAKDLHAALTNASNVARY